MPRPKGKGSHTRARIMAEAMELFATKGYASTTTKDIAQAAGIKDASIYNHFRSKRELFEAIVESEVEYLAEALRATGAMADPTDPTHPYRSVDADALSPVVLSSFRPLFDDQRVICLRKMLETNRYEDPRCGELFREIFVERPVAIQEAIFTELVANGEFVSCSPHFAAMEFYGSVFLLLIGDVTWEEASTKIERHLREFADTHRRTEGLHA